MNKVWNMGLSSYKLFVLSGPTHVQYKLFVLSGPTHVHNKLFVLSGPTHVHHKLFGTQLNIKYTILS